jgi:hypothetical protein
MRAASFKSLYQKRPSESMQMRTISSRALQIQHYDMAVLIRSTFQALKRCYPLPEGKGQPAVL